MSTPPVFVRAPFAAASALILGACSFGSPSLQETRELELSVSGLAYTYSAVFWALNLFWFRKLVAMARGARRKAT